MNRLLIILIGIILAANIALAADYDHTWHWLCLERGEQLPGYDRICDAWCCWYCVNEVGDAGDPGMCGQAAYCSCSGDVEPDLQPPEMIVHTPEEGAIYGSRAVDVYVEMPDEQAAVYVKNNNKLGATFYRICARGSDCYRTITVDEGENEWTFRAEDYFGNPTEEVRSFMVDGVPPLIRTTWPRDGDWASKTFGMQYVEEGLQSASLWYKQSGDWIEVSGAHCQPGRYVDCEIIIPNELEQGELTYKMCISDYATEVCSNPATVMVDTAAPDLDVVLPADDPDQVFDQSYVQLQLNTNEPVTMSYIDLEDPYHRERILCTGCMEYNRPMAFLDGYHNLIIMAIDQAGNPDQATREFKVDARAPRIYLTEPRAGMFGNENFVVQYNEMNVKEVALYYKQDEAGDYTEVIAPDGTCQGGTRASCTVTAEGIAQGDLWYYFKVTDIADAAVESRPTQVKIDTNDPVITVTKPDHTLYSDRRVPFDISVVDDNPVTIEYKDLTEPYDRWYTLITRAYEYSYDRYFRDGYHDLIIRARDPAGNTDEFFWDFIVDGLAPRIARSYPLNGRYGDGTFTAQYTEENPDVLTLYYKYNEEDEFMTLTNENCPGGVYAECSITVPDIQDGRVWYQFGLTDITGGEGTQYYAYEVLIDTDFPSLDIESPVSGPTNERYIPFIIHSDEPVIIEYKNYLSYYPQWKRLAYLVEDYDRNLGFNYGAYDIQIRVSDLAGNSVESEHIVFEVMP